MEKFIQEKLNMVLIDKVTIAGLSIRKIIDEERLFKKGVLSISGKTKKICIRKKDFPAIDILSLNITKNSGFVELSVHNLKYGNIVGWRIEEYLHYIRHIRNELKRRYGLILDMSQAHFSKIELNKTILLFQNYESYYPFFQEYVFSRKNGLYRDFFKDKSNDTVSFYAGTSTETIKIYNKSAQSQYKEETNLARVELKLCKNSIPMELGKIIWQIHDDIKKVSIQRITV